MVSVLITQTRVDFEAPFTDVSPGKALGVGEVELGCVGSADASTLGASEGVATDDSLVVWDGSIGAAERSVLVQPANRSALTTTASARGRVVIGLPSVDRVVKLSARPAHRQKRGV